MRIGRPQGSPLPRHGDADPRFVGESIAFAPFQAAAYSMEIEFPASDMLQIDHDMLYILMTIEVIWRD